MSLLVGLIAGWAIAWILGGADGTSNYVMAALFAMIFVVHYALLDALDKSKQKILDRLEQIDEATLRIENQLADLSYGGQENRLKAQLGDAYLPPEDREPGAYSSDPE